MMAMKIPGFLRDIKRLFENNPSDLHHENLRKRIDCGRGIAEAALKQHGKYLVGNATYSVKLNLKDYLPNSSDTPINQGGFSIYREKERKPEALVLFQNGGGRIFRRPKIIVRKGDFKGRDDCRVWKNLADALEKEGRYGPLKPDITLVDRRHSLEARHVFSTAARESEGVTCPPI